MRTLLTIVCLTAASAAIVGCQKEQSPAPAGGEHAGGAEEGHDDHDHAHDHGAGPHGGTIIEWGGGAYHLEFVVDHDAKSATAYVLGGDAETPAPIKTDTLVLALTEPDVEVDLTAQPLDDEADGMASRFVGTHEAIGEEQEFAGSITAEVEGTPYSGDFAEEAEDHGHEH
jgi:hypothetical protein